MTDALLPCPFCGGTNIRRGNYCVWCDDCSANTDVQGYAADGRMKAHIAWNRRQSPTTQRTLLDWTSTD